MNPSVLLGGALSILGAIQIEAAVLTGPVVNPANDHHYFLLSANTWINSESEAISLGGHLATINDAAENLWVIGSFSQPLGLDLWIGLTDQGSEGDFVWTSGEDVTYLNWSFGEPTNRDGFTGEPEHYTHIANPSSSLGAGKWNDLRDIGYGQIFGVVEVVPEPRVSLLLGLSALALLLRRFLLRSRPKTTMH